MRAQKIFFISAIIALLISGITICAGIKERNTFAWKPIDNVVKLKANGDMGWEGAAIFIADNLLITAGHCVDGAENIVLITVDGDEIIPIKWYKAENDDVALIFVNTLRKERAVLFADAVLGEDVIAIGNPMGHFPVITKGIISALNQHLDSLLGDRLFMCDAPLNPGNSGCAIWNMSNKIVGMYIGGYHNLDGLDFCVPADVIQEIVAEFFEKEEKV